MDHLVAMTTVSEGSTSTVALPSTVSLFPIWPPVAESMVEGIKKAPLDGSSSAEPTNIVDLEDLSLRCIFQRIPLSQLFFTISQLSTKLREAQIGTCNQWHRRLILLIGVDAEEILQDVLDKFGDLPAIDPFCTIVYPHEGEVPEETFTIAARDKLVISLPQVTSFTLTLARMDDTEYELILSLLHSWAPHITNLILVISPGRGSPMPFQFLLLPLLERLNALDALTHLTIYIGQTTTLLDAIHLPQFRLRILRSLRVFNYFLSEAVNRIFPSMPSIQRNDLHFQFESIKVAEAYSNGQEDVLTYNDLPVRVMEEYRKVNVGGFTNANLLTNFSLNFVRLNTLQMMMPPANTLGFEAVVESLAILPRLSELTLFGFDTSNQVLNLPPAPNANERPVLGTVHTLELSLTGHIQSHEDLVLLQFDLLLPSVRRFSLCGDAVDECQICLFAHERPRLDRTTRMIACLQHMVTLVRPFFDQHVYSEVVFRAQHNVHFPIRIPL